MVLNQLYWPTQLCLTLCQPSFLRFRPGELLYPHGGIKLRTAFDHLVRRVLLPALSPQWRSHSLRRGWQQFASCDSVPWTEQPCEVGGRASTPPVLRSVKSLLRWQPSALHAPNPPPSLILRKDSANRVTQPLGSMEDVIPSTSDCC